MERWRREHVMSGGIVSRTFGRWHALGPYIYVERGGFMLHAGARWFRLEYQRGPHWWLTLRIGGRYVIFKGAR